MNGYQITVLVFFVIGLLVNLYWDIEGRPAKEPSGFFGVIVSLVIYAFFAWLYYGAGLFGH